MLQKLICKLKLRLEAAEREYQLVDSGHVRDDAVAKAKREIYRELLEDLNALVEN